MEFLVPGTPEQVWHAIATGPGMSSWFAGTTVEERVGGAIHFDFGGGVTSSGKVTEWQPPHRLVYEESGWSGEAPPLATEMVVTARSGGKCVVRMVHSLFTTDDQWDDQVEGFEAGWPAFVEVLRIYLGHFARSKAAAVRVSGPYPGSEAEAWKVLTNTLGLSGANVEERRVAQDGAPMFAGTIDRVHQDHNCRDVMIRLDQPGPGVALVGTYRWGDQTRAAVSLFFYGDAASGVAAQAEPQWTKWIETHFPG
ncbi:MAG: SRPBCC domain-containing protein [Rhizobiales bacterium]|nr:SRPBCC domain-containing protein [Hyphomicrobiales bacterium]